MCHSLQRFWLENFIPNWNIIQQHGSWIYFKLLVQGYNHIKWPGEVQVLYSFQCWHLASFLLWWFLNKLCKRCAIKHLTKMLHPSGLGRFKPNSHITWKAVFHIWAIFKLLNPEFKDLNLSQTQQTAPFCTFTSYRGDSRRLKMKWVGELTKAQQKSTIIFFTHGMNNK